jgi:hypothetical protein
MKVDFPFPEQPETLVYQLRWLSQGKRAAVFIPYYMPNVRMGGEFSQVYTHRGLFIFNKEKLSEEEILKAVEEDTLGDILGYGISRKPQKPIGAVTIRAKNGIEKQAVVVGEEDVLPVLQAAHDMADDDDIVDIEDANAMVLKRINYWKQTVENSICQLA